MLDALLPAHSKPLPLARLMGARRALALPRRARARRSPSPQWTGYAVGCHWVCRWLPLVCRFENRSEPLSSVGGHCAIGIIIWTREFSVGADNEQNWTRPCCFLCHWLPRARVARLPRSKTCASTLAAEQNTLATRKCPGSTSPLPTSPLRLRGLPRTMLVVPRWRRQLSGGW